MREDGKRRKRKGERGRGGRGRGEEGREGRKVDRTTEMNPGFGCAMASGLRGVP